jgi:1-acyl-sn-glycerol-3-phosphate acyltransferase
MFEKEGLGISADIKGMTKELAIEKARKFLDFAEGKGLGPALLAKLKERGVEVEISCESPETRTALKEGRVLLLANHQRRTDPLLVMASLPLRAEEKLFALANSGFYGIDQRSDEHILPLYVKREESGDPMSSFLGRIGFDRGDMPEDEAREKNRGSISKAAQKLNEDGLVMLFPEGDRVKGERQGVWYPGVGHLLAEAVENGKRDKGIRFKIVFVKVDNAPGLARLALKSRLLPKVKSRVSFSSPIDPKDFFSGSQPAEGKALSAGLQSAYETWSKK